MAFARLTGPLIISLFIIRAIASTAVTPAAAPEPEKKITISIFDLVNKRSGSREHPKKTDSGLDRRYVELVVAALKEQRFNLLSCLKDGETLNAQIRIDIANHGEAQVSALDRDDTIADCAVKVLTEVHYPDHRLKGSVEIDLPLSIEKRTF